MSSVVKILGSADDIWKSGANIRSSAAEALILPPSGVLVLRSGVAQL